MAMRGLEEFGNALSVLQETGGNSVLADLDEHTLDAQVVLSGIK
jgi:hypothetical protein